MGAVLYERKDKNLKALEDDIAGALINRLGRENSSHTPDFILAGFLVDCLLVFGRAVVRRSSWYDDDPMRNSYRQVRAEVQQGGDDESERTPIEIKRIEIEVCERCLEGEPGVCHEPQCAFCRHDSLGFPVIPELYTVLDSWKVATHDEERNRDEARERIIAREREYLESKGDISEGRRPTDEA